MIKNERGRERVKNAKGNQRERENEREGVRVR